MTCSKLNFSNEKFSESINFVLSLESENIDSLFEDIISALKEKPFSVDINSSDNSTQYENSISELVDSIKDKITKSNKLKFDFSNQNLAILDRKLKESLLPPKKTKTELNIEAVIPHVGMYSQELVNNLEFNDVLVEVYGDNLTLRSYRETLFKDQLLIRTIIDTESKTIVDGVDILNENLKNFKSSEYLILKKFIQELKVNESGFDPELIANSYYYGENMTSKVNNVYTIMYNYILYLKEQGTLEDTIKAGWEDKLNGKESLFFDALNAYINLQFFDNSLRQAFGKYIQINRDYDEPINIVDNKQVYKYTLSTGNSEMIHGWETSDYLDAIDLMSGYSGILIGSIPLISYDNKLKTNIGQFQRLNPVYFANAIINLRSAIESMPDGSELLKLLTSTLEDPSQWVKLLQQIFKPDTLKSTTNKLLSVKSINGDSLLNKFDLNILYSLYQQVLNPNNSKSYNSIESKYTSLKGVRDRYPIIGTLFGLMNSTAGMNYLELVYDSNTEIPGYRIRIKRKFNSNMTTWDMIKAINRNIYTRANKNDILKSYPIITKNKEKEITITFEANNTKIPITLDLSTHILDKKSNSIFTKEVDGVFNTKGELLIDINSIPARQKLFDSNITLNEKLFMSILSFIDNMLGTTFSSDTDGLLELSEFIKQGGKFINLYLAATRALEIINIYNQIENNKDYQRTEILRFLKENPEVYQREIWARESLSSFIKIDKRGAYLTTVDNSESWIRTLVTARMIINGSTSKAVTKNAEGDSIPNTSPTYLGAELQSYLSAAYSDILNNASSYLLFSHPNARTAIKGVVVDTDIKLKDGSTKLIQNMTESELLTHAIIDKFHLALSKNRGTVFIQSTTFSDKTKYVGQEISLNDLGLDIYDKNISDICTKRLFETVGGYYKKIWNNVLNDYEKIFGTRDISIIELHLNGMNELQFIVYASNEGEVKNASNTKVTVYKDTHYRAIGDGLSINELLYNYANDLYDNIDNLTNRLNIERVLFINDLINTRTNFYINRLITGDIDLQDPIGNFISKWGDIYDYERKWINGNQLIPAKIKNIRTGKERNIEFAKVNLQTDELIILNPFLESYFSTDILLSNNLRYSLTGSEINHKIKGGVNVVNSLNGKIPNLFGFTTSTTPVMALQTLKNIITDPKLTEELKTLASKAYNEIRDLLIYAREAGGQGALLKRNVIIPATMRHYLQNLIEGIPSLMEIAVIDDILAFVQNFDGSGCKNKKGGYSTLTIDAHDGFAFINPIMSILENYSLQDNEVGDMKKNILHSYDHKYGSATLLKYAAGSMTNAWMRQSELSPVSLRNIFKKMSNRRWSKRFLDGRIEWLLTDNGKQSGEINLIESGYKSDDTCTLNFARDILQGKGLFYKDKGVTKAIIGFGRTGQDYYTIELEVSFNGDPVKGAVPEKVYHYYNNEGIHETSSTPFTPEYKFLQGIETWHTIDSIYELWTALGGLNSLELVNGTLGDSEASLYATTAFVNFVGNRKAAANSNEINQINYDQPLKRAFIGYLVNNSAIKNGAGNLNPTSSFYDNTPFRTITIDTKGHGVQLDADHHADEAEMTEFSLVITSLDAGGRMHNYVRLIYNVLGKVALDLSEIEIDAVEEFQKTGNKSKIYDLIGRTIMKNMREGQKGLLKAIMTEVQKEFNIDADHARNIFKIPFSDPNIYSLILSTFVSIINRKSIKRKYPGSGMVMMPGYDIETVFDYNGLTYQYLDLLKLAEKTISSEIKTSIKASDNADYDKQLVQALLKIGQDKQVITPTLDWVNPSDIINIHINGQFVSDISLNTIEDYYNFKQANNRNFLVKKITGLNIVRDFDENGQSVYKVNDEYYFNVNEDGSFNTTDTTKLNDIALIYSILTGLILYQKNTFKARNLAPVKINWTLPNGQNMNIFDHWAIKALYEYGVRDKNEILKAFDLLNEGLYLDGYYDSKTRKFVYIGEPIKVTNITNTAAECVVPNIFLSKFNLTSALSLIDILNNPRIFNRIVIPISSDNYDITFTKNNNRNTYITFKTVQDNSDTFESSLSKWDDTIIEDMEDLSSGIIHRVFAVDRDNVKLFEVARERLVTNVLYDSRQGAFTDNNGTILDNSNNRYKRYGDKVLEVVNFIQRRKVKETKNNQTNRYTLYNINRNALSEVYIPSEDKTIDDFIGKLMSDIYNSDDFNGVLLNTKMTTSSANILRKSLNLFAINQSHDLALKDLILGDGKLPGLRDLLSASKNLASSEYKIPSALNKRILTNYLNKLANEIRSSFEKSLYFTASRIPAQSHLSFMLMRAVGFTRNNVTHTFVSHFLTWLQGSDY